MPKAILRSYSRFYDVETRTEFLSVLDQESGCYIACADVSDEVACILSERSAPFEILDEASFLRLVTPVAKPALAPSGDPIVDLTGVEPPAPPADKDAPAKPSKSAPAPRGNGASALDAPAPPASA